jgi:hypothetical protein
MNLVEQLLQGAEAARRRGDLDSATIFLREARALHYRKAKGKWLTIGKGGHGAPVFVQGGVVKKGCPGLLNRSIEDLDSGEETGSHPEDEPEAEEPQAEEPQAEEPEAQEPVAEEPPAYKGKQHVAKVVAAWQRFEDRQNTARGGGLFGGEDLQARQGFSRLPDGAPILFTSGEFKGQTGKIVREEGRIVAEVDDRPGLVPVSYDTIEPLSGALSWRTEAAQGPLEQKSLLSADLFLPKRKEPEAEEPIEETIEEPIEEPAKPKKREVPQSTHRQDLRQEREYSRAVWAKKARKEGLDPKALHELAGEILARDRETAQARTQLLRRAREQLAHYGYDARALTTNLRSGRVEDEVPALDVVADSLYRSYPEHFRGSEDDLPGRLLDLLTEGNPEPMDEATAYEVAMGQLRHAGEAAYTPSDEPLPFARRGPLRYRRQLSPGAPFEWRTVRAGHELARQLEVIGNRQLLAGDWKSAWIYYKQADEARRRQPPT